MLTFKATHRLLVFVAYIGILYSRKNRVSHLRSFVDIPAIYKSFKVAVSTGCRCFQNFRKVVWRYRLHLEDNTCVQIGVSKDYRLS